MHSYPLAVLYAYSCCVCRIVMHKIAVVKDINRIVCWTVLWVMTRVGVKSLGGKSEKGESFGSPSRSLPGVAHRGSHPGRSRFPSPPTLCRSAGARFPPRRLEPLRPPSPASSPLPRLAPDLRRFWGRLRGTAHPGHPLWFSGIPSFFQLDCEQHPHEAWLIAGAVGG